MSVGKLGKCPTHVGCSGNIVCEASDCHRRMSYIKRSYSHYGSLHLLEQDCREFIEEIRCRSDVVTNSPKGHHSIRQ